MSSLAMAQSESELVGRWEVTYEDYKGKSIYEFRSEQGKVVGYSIHFTDENGDEYEDNSMVVTKLEFDGKNGEASYKVQYDEDEYFTTDISLKKKSETHLLVHYSYWGFSNEETWTRVIENKNN